MIARRLGFKILHGTHGRLENFTSSGYGRHVLDEIPQSPLVPAHRYMLNLMRQNRQVEALVLFRKHVQMDPSSIDEVALALASKACVGHPNLGAQILGFAMASDYMRYVAVSNSLMNVYCKSQDLRSALCIFKNLSCPDTVSYNTVLSGFEDGQSALSFASEMHSSGVTFDAVTFTCVLAHCANGQELEPGVQFHCLVVKLGLMVETFIGNALVTMYSRCGVIVDAKRVFYGILYKDLVSWNALLSGYAQDGRCGLEAILMFIEMVKVGLKPDHVSFTGVISACGLERILEFGKQVHGLSIKSGYGTHVSVCNVLMSMYSKCDVVGDVKFVFEDMAGRNVVSWTTMLSVDEEDAMTLFKEMLRCETYPNDVTFIGLIHALTVHNMIKEALMVHGICIKSNFLTEVNVANCFITMYGKFMLVADCLKIFEELNKRDIISWNALVSAYCLNGMYQEALKVFLSASQELLPNAYTFGSMLHAIASSESISLRMGQCCHSFLRKLGLNTDPVVSGALLDMYAKRGNICESQRIFHELIHKNQLSWTAIISAHSKHGGLESVMKYFKEMLMVGMKPDSITFLSVLTSCGHNGMVDMGIEIFNSMINEHSVEPSAEHFSCMADMLARAGRLEEAERFLSQIPGGPGISVLQSLLGACRTYGNVDMAIRISNALIAMEPNESGSYVLMANLFAEKGKWEKVAKIRRVMRDRKVTKEIGFSWADVGNADDSIYLHGFTSGDKSHRLSGEIYMMAWLLGSEIKEQEDPMTEMNSLESC